MFGQHLSKVLSEEKLKPTEVRKSYAAWYLEMKALKQPVVTPKRLIRKGMANDKIDPKITAWLK